MVQIKSSTPQQQQSIQSVPQLVQITQQSQDSMHAIDLPQLTQIPQLTQLSSKPMSPKPLPPMTSLTTTTTSGNLVTFVPATKQTPPPKTQQPYKILIATKPTTQQRKPNDSIVKQQQQQPQQQQQTIAIRSDDKSLKALAPSQINSNVGLTCLLTQISKQTSPGTPITLPISMPITIPISNQLALPISTTITLPMSTSITPKTEIQVTKIEAPAIKYTEIDDMEISDARCSLDSEYKSDISTLAEKYKILAANTLTNFDMSTSGNNSDTKPTMINTTASSDTTDDTVELFACRICGKKYRWKSTLRRHETEECGNKEPSHQCPYCKYKAKQRGNLGVHLRKHHKGLPQLESLRKKKPFPE